MDAKNNLEELRKWFPTGTAEGERGILDKVFVFIKEFNQVISPPPGSPYILVGSKGSGKSAILDFATRLLNRQAVPAIFLHPYDIETSDLNESHSMGDLIRDFRSILLFAVSAKLSENSGTFLRGTMPLYITRLFVRDACLLIYSGE
jgi:hypothetical protein